MATLEDLTSTVWSLSFSPDLQRLAIASGLLFLLAWTLANGEEIRAKVIAVADGDTLTVPFVPM